MEQKKVKVTIAPGVLKEGIEVDIDESTERWSEIKLKDGAIIKVKFSPLLAIKIDGEFTPEGMPNYILQGTPMVAVVSVPDELRKK